MIFDSWSISSKCMLIMICLVIAVMVIRPKYQETFVPKDDHLFYKIYDSIFYHPIDSQYEIAEIVQTMNTSSRILDIGSGTGHRVSSLYKKGLKVVGLEESDLLHRDTKRRLPKCDLRVGSASNALTFPPESFTHIMCLDHAIYQYKDKSNLVENIRQWLVPDGLFIVHLPPEHTRTPNSGFYNSMLYGNLFVETVGNKNNRVRRRSNVYMESIDHMLYMIKQHGFTEVSKHGDIRCFKKHEVF